MNPARSAPVAGIAALAVTILAAACLPPPARAAVSIGPSQITVTGDGARAVVDRKPFRLEFQDATGRTVLRQAPNEGEQPNLVAPTFDPEPFSTETLPRPALYEPLSFLVGDYLTTQCPGNVCGGNFFAGVEGGVEYSAREVVGAVAEGEGVKLTLSTSDPTGRQLVVTVAPGPSGSMRVQAVPTPSAGVVVMSDAFASPAGEAFRGFGGRHDAIDHRGHQFYSWPEQENSYSEGGEQATGQENYQFPNGPHAAYYPQALFYSSEPYGFLLNQTELARFRLASDTEHRDAWHLAVNSAKLDYLIAPGDAPKAIKTITDVNGRHRVPPAWAVGPMTTQLVAPGVSLDPAKYERLIRDDIKMIDKFDVPIEAYDVFGWPILSDETNRDLIREFHKRGIKVLSYFPAFAGTGESGYEEKGVFEEAIAKGYAVKTATGQPFVIANPLVVGEAVMIDFTNPEAVKWWQGRLRRNLDLGFDGFMEDFGEQILVDMHFANGENGRTMHNKYPNVYHAATRPLLEAYEREHPGRELWNYTRSGYSGTTDFKGSAHWESANFPGDNSATWDQGSGLKSAAPDMLSRAVGGAYGFSTDIGGYLGDTPRELLLRWSEWAALSPHFRLHNSSSNGTRNPWFFDAEAVRIFNIYARLHQRARPLILDLFREAQRTGIPPTRPMWLQFPGDAEAAKQQQQWMLGPDVLAAPVVDEGAKARQVYFPAGCWQHGETGEVFQGPRAAKVDAALSSLPYFFKCGTNPFAAAAAAANGNAKGGQCLSRRSPIGPRNVGRVRVGLTRRQLLRRVGPKPAKRTRHAYHWCVRDARRGGRVTAVFGQRKRAVLVVSSAPAHGNRKVRPSSRARALRRAYPKLRRVVRGVFRASRRNPRLFVVRSGKVRMIGVADKRLLRSKRALRLAVRRAGE